jgi:hypothetical protein
MVLAVLVLLGYEARATLPAAPLPRHARPRRNHAELRYGHLDFLH